jgi:DNA invertase Pin-like site-specific DNA recombinase
MKIGYCRCSTIDQNTARQEKILKDLGCEKIYTDMISGKNRDRPGLQQMMSYIREGDVLYVESISRLARSTHDLLDIIDELQKKKVSFVSDKERIDTDTPQGQFMLTVFAAMAELERSQIRQRQAEGIAIAKREGKYQGRRPKTIDYILLEELYERWRKGEITQKYMCSKLKVSRSTLFRIIKKRYRSSISYC